MAMALLPPDLSSLSAAFSFTDFCKALGYADGGKEYQIFTAAVDECLKTVISIETGITAKGKKSWEKFQWFDHAKFNAETGICTMRFSKELADFLKEFKKVYSKINLSDIGKLQSKYGIRIFELARSYSSLEGKDGNPENTWYFERSLQEIRKIFELPANMYPEIRDFRKRVIEEPVKEINNAGIGLEIATESVKQGRKLAGIRFNCQQTARKLPAKRGRKKKADTTQLELPNIPTADQTERFEKELEHLKELYPAEFAELYEAALVNASTSIPEGFKQLGAERIALMQLKERHGIVK